MALGVTTNTCLSPKLLIVMAQLLFLFQELFVLFYARRVGVSVAVAVRGYGCWPDRRGRDWGGRLAWPGITDPSLLAHSQLQLFASSLSVTQYKTRVKRDSEAERVKLTLDYNYGFISFSSINFFFGTVHYASIPYSFIHLFLLHHDPP